MKIKHLGLVASITLSGCVVEGTTEEHVEQARILCNVAGGFKAITTSTFEADLESCGNKCWRENGVFTFNMTAICKDGTIVRKSWKQARK